MTYYTSGWFCLMGGSAAVGAGGALFSWAWHLLAKAPLRKVTFAVLLILGSALIGAGGFFTTKGWDLLGNHSRRRAQLIALGREWSSNQAYLEQAPFRFGPQDGEIGKVAVFYPKFKSSAASAILASDLFDPARHKTEARLFAALTEAEMHTGRVNDLLTFFNRQVTTASTTQPERAAWYRDIPGSRMLTEFRLKHDEIKGIVTAHFPWALP